MASAKVIDSINKIIDSKVVAVSFSHSDDIKRLKEKFKGKVSFVGNLDGISMRKWTYQDVEKNVKELIINGASGGGLVISDSHGEIPWYVSEEVLYSISEVVQKYGTYPIKR